MAIADAPPVPVTDGLWAPARRSLTLGLVFTVTLVAFEALAVSTVMPIVARDLGDLALYGWVFSAFFLGSLVGIVVAGGLIDRGGLVRPFLAGLGLFAAGLVVAGLAPSMAMLVAGRFLQGLGAGAIPPTAYVAIGRSLPDRLRPRMFATLSTAWVLPGVFGPAIAAIVGEQLHWRAVFLGLLPLIALAGAMTLPAIAGVAAPADAAAAEGSAASDSRRRLPQAVRVTLGAGLVLAGLTSGVPLAALALVAVGLALGVPAFGRLTPAGTLRVGRGLPAAVLLRGIQTFAFFGAATYVPLAIQDWRGASATVAGIALTAATISWTAGAWIQERRIGRWGARRLVRLGFATTALGVALTALVLAPTLPVAVVVPAWALTGLGMGLAYSPLSIVVLREAPPAEQGAATAGLQLSDTLGTALGAGIAGAIVAAGERVGAAGWIGLATAFGLGAAAAVGGWVASRRLRPHVHEGAATGRTPAAPGAA